MSFSSSDFSSSRKTAILLTSCIFLLFGDALVSVNAFVSPKTFGKSMMPKVASSSTTLQQMNINIPESFISTAVTTATTATTTTNIILSEDVQAVAAAESALAGVRTFFIAITAVAFAFAGFTYVVAAFIVPKAAKRLEEDTKRIRPGLWEEYESKLELGQTMDMRPDLLQELGNIMQPLIIEDFEKSAGIETDTNSSSTNVGGSESKNDSDK